MNDVLFNHSVIDKFIFITTPIRGCLIPLSPLHIREFLIYFTPPPKFLAHPLLEIIMDVNCEFASVCFCLQIATEGHLTDRARLEQRTEDLENGLHQVSIRRVMAVMNIPKGLKVAKNGDQSDESSLPPSSMVVPHSPPPCQQSHNSIYYDKPDFPIFFREKF